jgi:hypothetical protein
MGIPKFPYLPQRPLQNRCKGTGPDSIKFHRPFSSETSPAKLKKLLPPAQKPRLGAFAISW